jgi:hypothetical protein
LAQQTMHVESGQPAIVPIRKFDHD